MKSFIPEGWRVLIDESTLYDAVMYNDELDVRIHFRDRTRWAADTYAYDQSKDAFYWNDISEKGESNHFTYEKPDYIEYDLQVYAEYLGYSKEEYLNDYYPISLYRRTEPDGSVFIDYDTDERSLLVSITEEDYFKMQNAGKYTAILTLTGRTFNCVFERDSDYAVFCYYFLDEQWNGFWDPNSIDYYVYDIK